MIYTVLINLLYLKSMSNWCYAVKLLLDYKLWNRHFAGFKYWSRIKISQATICVAYRVQYTSEQWKTMSPEKRHFWVFKKEISSNLQEETFPWIKVSRFVFEALLYFSSVLHCQYYYIAGLNLFTLPSCGMCMIQ